MQRGLVLVSINRHEVRSMGVTQRHSPCGRMGRRRKLTVRVCMKEACITFREPSAITYVSIIMIFTLRNFNIFRNQFVQTCDEERDSSRSDGSEVPGAS